MTSFPGSNPYSPSLKNSSLQDSWLNEVNPRMKELKKALAEGEENTLYNQIIDTAKSVFNELTSSGELSPDDLHAIVERLKPCDISADPSLKKTAALFDQIIQNIPSTLSIFYAHTQRFEAALSTAFKVDHEKKEDHDLSSTFDIFDSYISPQLAVTNEKNISKAVSNASATIKKTRKKAYHLFRVVILSKLSQFYTSMREQALQSRKDPIQLAKLFARKTREDEIALEVLDPNLSDSTYSDMAYASLAESFFEAGDEKEAKRFCDFILNPESREFTKSQLFKSMVTDGSPEDSGTARA